MMLGSRFYQLSLIERQKLTEGYKLPILIAERLCGNERSAVLFQITHRTLAVGMGIQILAVGKDQVELVALRHVADNLV